MSSKSHGRKNVTFNTCIHKLKIKEVKHLTINCKDCGGHGRPFTADDLEDY
ncbi:hypothetical protein [Bacillus sp. FJAT-42315]|uniref:hypothetical protein n=1 Tax=Bacillus sp. FJAT-42315 TaxID=2014077 RepID=UPI0012FF504D|nr:hypothetical protein [Bacillus sp. FJAT-42315]